MNGKVTSVPCFILNEERPKLLKHDTDSLFLGRLGEEPTVDVTNLVLNPFKLLLLFPDRKLNAQTIRQSVIANWLNEKRIALEDVQLMSGQKFPSSTEKYRRKDSEQQRKLINQFHPLR